MNLPESMLTVAFPPSKGFRGACTTIRDLDRRGLYAGHLGITPSKRAAVRLIAEVRLCEQRARGHGNRWRRRLAAKCRPVEVMP